MGRGKYRVRIAAVLMLSFLAAVFLLVEKPWAEDKKKEEQGKAEGQQVSWVVRCDDLKEGDNIKGKYCEMVQSISVSKKDADPSTAQRLFELAIGYPPVGGGKANGVMILPLGILVSEDVVMEIDGSKEKDVRVRYCDASGCVAAFELSEKEMEKLSKGRGMTVRTVAATNQPVTIELSLSGFSDAYKKIKPKEVGGLFH